MAHRDSYLEGTPSWVDLASTDIDGAKSFYSALFGWDWEANDTDQPDNQYHMASLGGRSAAGLMQQPQEQVDVGCRRCGTFISPSTTVTPWSTRSRAPAAQ